jgi:hypothetical protein
MSTSYTSLLGLALPVTNENVNTWGDLVNNSVTSLLDTAIAGTTTLSSDADVTLTTSTGTSNQARQAIILWTATGTATRTITAPATSKLYVVVNKTGGTQSIQFKASGSSSSVTIAAGGKAFLVFNGTDFVSVSPVNFSNLILDAGTTATAPIKLTSGANLTTATAGAFEYDGASYFQTIDTTSGRGVVPVSQFILGTSNSGLSTVSPVIITSGSGGYRLSLVTGALYEYEAEVYLSKSTSGTLTWGFNFSTTPGYMHAHYVGQPTAGISSVGSATTAGIINSTGTTINLPNTGTLSSGTDNHYRIKALISTASATTMYLQVTSNTGSVNIYAGSYAKITRLPTTSVGTLT